MSRVSEASTERYHLVQRLFMKCVGSGSVEARDSSATVDLRALVFLVELIALPTVPNNAVVGEE